MKLSKNSEIYIKVLREAVERVGGNVTDVNIIENALYISMQCTQLENSQQHLIVDILNNIKDH